MVKPSASSRLAERAWVSNWGEVMGGDVARARRGFKFAELSLPQPVMLNLFQHPVRHLPADDQLDPSEFTNEVQHLRQVLPCPATASFRSRNGVRLPAFMKAGNRSGKSLQLWIASRRPCPGS